MIKQITLFCTVLALAVPSLSKEAKAEKEPEEESFTAQFIHGNYVAVGKYPDTDSTYTLKISLFKKGKGMKFTRSQGKRKITGSAKVQKTLGGESEVLRVAWVEKGKKFEGTFVIGGDLDNYGRLTGYTYREDGTTKKAGLEAWFCDAGQLESE